MYCSSCGAGLPDSARYCSSCGARVAAREAGSAWSRFTHLGRERFTGEEIGGRGPRTIGRGGGAVAESRHLPHGLETGAGGAEKAPRDVEVFARKQAQQVRRYEVDPQFWLPDWVRQHIDSGGRPEELVQIVIQRVRQDPREATWKEAQVLLNELGRGPDGSALIRNPLVQKFIGEAARLSCREEG